MGVLDWRGYPTMSQPLTVPQDMGWMRIPEQAPGNLAPVPNAPQRPAMLDFVNQPRGPLSQMAYELAGSPTAGPRAGTGGLFPFAGSPILGSTGAGTDPSNSAKDKMTGAAGGALAGYKVGGPWGALVGGVLGYGLNGGAKDLNPIDASGFSGIGMDQAREQGNLARLGSNPAAALASYAGIKSNSDIGRALDPTSFLGGLFRSSHGDEKRNLKAFTSQYPVTEAGNGMVVLPDGRTISKDQLQKLAGAWYGATYHPDGDQAGWQDKFNSLLGDIYNASSPYTQPPGTYTRPPGG